MLLLLAGCAVQPDYERPPVELPQAWKATAPRYAEDGRWWRIYGDESLNQLVEEALAQNTDVLVAAARVDEARALLGIAESARKPQVDAGLAAGRSQASTATGLLPPGTPRERDNYSAVIGATWEIDVFGRLRAATGAARAELAASEAVRDAVRLSLTARVALSYNALQALDAQVRVTRRTLASREEALAIQRRRREGGVISDFDLRQFEAETASVRAQLPPLLAARDVEEAALAVLVGRSPRAVMEDTMARGIAPETPGAAVVPAGLPSELLLRRPDLVEAEQRLVAANARVAEARAAYFPSIRLSGVLGSESQDLSNLFTGPAGIWNFVASLTQPIYAGGRLDAQRDAALARERAALAQYQGAIRNAFGDVRQALVVQARALEAYEAQSDRVKALTESARLARVRYLSGVASQLEVLDAERGLLDAQNARIDALRAQRAAVAGLFRALGG